MTIEDGISFAYWSTLQFVRSIRSRYWFYLSLPFRDSV